MHMKDTGIYSITEFSLNSGLWLRKWTTSQHEKTWIPGKEIIIIICDRNKSNIIIIALALPQANNYYPNPPQERGIHVPLSSGRITSV